MGKKAFGEQNPTQGEDPVSWQTWSDGSSGIPTVIGNADWGKLRLSLSSEEGRSLVYDLGSGVPRLFTVTLNRYGAGRGSAITQIRGGDTSFAQDDVSPDWAIYSAPISRNWRYVQIREITGNFYFVNAAGDDDNPGTLAEPWLHHPWDVNATSVADSTTLQPGDTVYCHGGDSGTRWNPNSAGTDGAWITTTTYGTGRYSVDGSASKAFSVTSTAYHHFRIEHIDFHGSTDANQHVVKSNTHDQFWLDCVFRDGAGPTEGNGQGFSAYTVTGSELYNITLSQCLAQDNDGIGIEIGSVDGTQGPHDCLISYCEASGNGTTQSLDHGIYVRHGVVIDHNYAHDNPVGAGIKVNCQGVTNSPYHPIVSNNISSFNKVGLTLDNVYSLVFNNKFVSNTYYGMSISQGDHSTVIFNSFVNATTDNVALIFVTQADIQGLTMTDNIFVQDAAVNNIEIFRLNASTAANFGADNTVDWNTVYHNGVITHGVIYEGGSSRGWSYWQGAGLDANGTFLTALPDFVARYTDIHPADGGNLKGLGIAIAGYELDLDGNIRADPPTPGAYDQASA